MLSAECSFFYQFWMKKKKDLNVNIFLNWIQLGQSRGRQRVPLSLRKPIHEERGQEQRWLKNNERFMMKSRGLGVRSCPGLFAALHFKSIHFLCNPHGCKAHALSHTGGLTHLPIYDVVNLHDVSAGNWLHDEEEDGGIKWGYECKIIARCDNIKCWHIEARCKSGADVMQQTSVGLIYSLRLLKH